MEPVQGRISILPPDRGRSPSAARGRAEAFWKGPTPSGQTTRCEPGTVRGPAGAVPGCAPVQSGENQALTPVFVFDVITLP